MSTSVWQWVLLQLADAVTGSGLLVVLALCSSELDSWVALGCAGLGTGLALALCSRPPLVLQALHLVFPLVVTLSVCLNLFASLCPPEGKEIVLIPVYILLCLSRPQVTHLSGITLALLSLAFVLVFSIAVITYPGVMEAQLGVNFTAADATFVGGSSIVLTAAYGGLSHMLHVYASDEGQAPFECVALGALCRLAVFAGVGFGKSALLSLFLAPERPTLHPQPPNYLSVLYGVCLLLSCMHMASAWFQQLKSVTAALSGRAYTAKRLVRLHHVLNAGLVGAAWGFPLYLGEIRVLGAGVLLIPLLYCRLGTKEA